MKSKKLFAILTLVAFLMTLLPMAAFAVAAPAYSYTYTTLSASNTSVDDVYDGTVANAAKFTLTFKDAAKAIVTDSDVTFVIETSKDLGTGWVKDFGGADQALNATMGSADGQTITTTPDASGKVEFYVGSLTATSFTVTVWADEVDGKQIGTTKTVTVEKEGGDIALEAYESDDDDAATTAAVIAGDGFDLRAEMGDGEEDVEVTFKQRIDGGSWTVVGTSTSDEDGIAALWVEADKAGDYEFKAEAGSDDSNELSVTVTADKASDIVLKTAAGKAAVDKSKTVEVYVKDDNGNLVKSEAQDIVKWEFISVPADSEYEDAELFTGTNDRGIAKLSGTGTDSFQPDVVGKYVIKISLDDTVDPDVGRDSETIEFDAIELGTVTGLSFDLVNADKDALPSVRYLEEADDDIASDFALVRAWYLNAGGAKVLESAPATNGITFASSDAGIVTILDSGYIKVVDDEYTGPITITATYEDDSVVGTYVINVVDAPNSFTATPVVTGKTAAVKIQLVDKNGKATTSTKGDFVTKEEFKVLAPSGVTVTDKVNLDQAGAGTFNLTATEYGEYNVTVTATVDDNAAYNATEKSITKTFAVKFEQPASEKPVIGAKAVTMFIGNTGYVQDGAAKVSDVAPFIKDGRTFVAVRPIADAFGATIAYNEATQTVTLTRADKTVTIVIGSPAITVVAGGVTKTVTADVPAFIMNGRTVLPFRAVGDAFGATVSYDAATQAVSFVQ